MVYIIAEILSLIQYLEALKNRPEDCRLEKCPGCGKANPWLHGCYPRKADRSNSAEASLNPIFIQRVFCQDCRKTFSVLPACIPPRRWYLWSMQQIGLLLLLAGESLKATAKKIIPSRHTIKRWLTRFKEQFHLHKDVLCNQFIELGRTINFVDFWQEFLKSYSLSTAMYLCHAAGVSIP
jgi:transposase-like protein